jgi:hypothetical protein
MGRKTPFELPLFLWLFERRGDNGLVAQGDHILHDAVGDLDGIALALFVWFNHAASLSYQGWRTEKKFQSSPLPLDLHPCGLWSGGYNFSHDERD